MEKTRLWVVVGHKEAEEEETEGRRAEGVETRWRLGELQPLFLDSGEMVGCSNWASSVCCPEVPKQH